MTKEEIKDKFAAIKIATDLREKLVSLIHACGEIKEALTANIPKDDNYFSAINEKAKEASKAASEVAGHFTVRMAEIEKLTTYVAELNESVNKVSSEKEVQKKILQSIKDEAETGKNSFETWKKKETDEINRLHSEAKSENEAAKNLLDNAKKIAYEAQVAMEQASTLRKDVESKFQKVKAIIG